MLEVFQTPLGRFMSAIKANYYAVPHLIYSLHKQLVLGQVT